VQETLSFQHSPFAFPAATPKQTTNYHHRHNHLTLPKARAEGELWIEVYGRFPL
jgi:hypothetical protein